MSTPATAPSIHHQHHFYPQTQHYSDYNLPSADYRPHGPSSLRLPYNYEDSAHSSPDFRQASIATLAPKRPSNASIAHSYKESPEMPSNAVKKKGANWNEFYRNGVPKEIIVIDDDDSPDRSSHKSKRTATQLDTQPTVAGATVRHADKRRKIEQPSAAKHESSHQSRYPATKGGAYHDEDYTSTETSSRGPSTTGHYSTGPTSLGSSSSGSTRVARLDSTQVGQKRKRFEPEPDEEESEVEVTSHKQHDVWGPYIPPPKPPIKAKEVWVRPVPDKSHSTSHKCDDQDGHYLVIPEHDLTERYSIVRLLGQGTFGKVVEAVDKFDNKRYAIKIIRAVSKYRDASRIELRVLTTLASNDKRNRNRCIHLRDCFDFRNHICIVTDLLSESVFDFLKKNTFTPFPSTHIQSFARQLFTSVAFLHDLSLIHTDLKPENILLVSNQYQTFTYNRSIPSSSKGNTRSSKQRRVLFDPEIRLIDFGSATFEDEYHSSVVSTRHYRAPEIILNLGWSYPCDIWSIGCILVEFYTGDALFQTHDNLEHLAMMEAVCGNAFEKDIIDKVRAPDRRGNKNSAAQYFRPRAYAMAYPARDTPRQSKQFVKNMKRLEETILPSNRFNQQFLDLLRQIFVYDPHKRITAKKALEHPWFKELLQDDGTEAKRIQREKLKAGTFR